MDNFMDKLAKRFSAGELIKANGAAEERELQRAKERAAENEKLIQEIRRLNLKNVELLEQVGQLIQCGIEQFEEYDRAGENANQTKEVLQELQEYMKEVEEAQRTELASLKRDVEKSAEASGNVQDKLADAKSVLQEDIKDVKKSIAAIDEKISGESSQDALLQELTNNLSEEINKLKESIKLLEEHVHKENVKVYRNVQAVVVDQASQKAREIGDRLDAMERNTKKNKSLMPLTVVTFLAAAASLVLQLLQMF